MRSILKQIVEFINKTSATDEEVEDLLGNEEVFNLVKQLNDAIENNDDQRNQTSFKQLRFLITSISQSEQITEPSASVTEASAPVTVPSTSDTEPSAPDSEASVPVTEPSAPVTVPHAPVTAPSASDTEPSAPRYVK